MYAKVQDNVVVQYPFTQTDLQAQYPDASVPYIWTPEFMSSEGIVIVVATGQPAYDILTQKVVEAAPVFSGTRWEQSWVVVEQTAEEQAETINSLKAQYTQDTQQRLDDFAKTRIYDSITAACTYETSTNATFAAEGQYCVEARDATWEALYQIFADVDAGLRPMPTSYAEIEPELPALAWP